MSIPITVVQKLDIELGISGRLHHILYNGEWIDTVCMEWSQSPSVPDIFASITQELKDAIQRSQEYLQQEYTNEPAVKLREFFSNEPAHIQDQYSEFMAKLQEANSPVSEPTPMPELSQELQNAMARVQERLQREEFQDGDEFDIDRYIARVSELFQEEPPHIQAERAVMASKLKEYSAMVFRAARKRRRTLKQVRSLLGNEPVIAYRAGIEWEGVFPTTLDTIVVAPTTDQFDILRYERTNGANRGLQTEDIIEKLKALDEKYRIDIVGVGSDGVEFILKRIPKGKEAHELGKWLLSFCPDLYEAPSAFPKGRISLWWD